MASDDDDQVSPDSDPDVWKRRVFAAERKRRHAARQFYRDAPAYRVEFGLDGTVFLGLKCYEYWPNRPIEDATSWRIISCHTDLDEVERHIRKITGAPIYYDETGRVARSPLPTMPRWEPPPDDDD